MSTTPTDPVGAPILIPLYLHSPLVRRFRLRLVFNLPTTTLALTFSVFCLTSIGAQIRQTFLYNTTRSLRSFLFPFLGAPAIPGFLYPIMAPAVSSCALQPLPLASAFPLALRLLPCPLYFPLLFVSRGLTSSCIKVDNTLGVLVIASFLNSSLFTNEYVHPWFHRCFFLEHLRGLAMFAWAGGDDHQPITPLSSSEPIIPERPFFFHPPSSVLS